jgi:hypothetical protein
MDKKTTILYGVLGAAFVGGIIYYLRAKKLQTDVISALKIDLQNAGIQLPTLTPVSGTQVPLKPTQLPTSTTPIRSQSSPIRTTSSSQQVGNEVKAPRFGEYGQPSNQTYGQPPNTQVGQDFGSGNQYGGELIFDTGAGYGGNLLYDTGGTGYGGNVLYDTGSSEYGGDTIFDTGASQYGGLVLADTGEPCKPTYGTGDWVVSGNQCLGN